MALLTFPSSPFNGQVYPLSPPVNTQVYMWSTADNTWVLLGLASGVVPATYGDALHVPQITVDSTGRITLAVDVPIQLGDTTQIGLVQLVDDTVSNDPTKALTAAQGFKLQNEIGDVSLLAPSFPDVVSAINAINAPTGVTSGTYGDGRNVGRFTVNAQGRITFATSVPLAAATTAAPGVVQLVDDTVTNDSTKALTAAAGYDLQQQIDAINLTYNLTFAGTIDGATGWMLQVTPEGTAAGFLPGVVVPASTLSNEGYFVIATVAGSFTPTVSPPVTVNVGDWLVSEVPTWVKYSVGPSPVAPPQLVFLDDLSGQFNGAQQVFTMTVGGSAISPGSNLLVFVGGVPQISGSSYSVGGSTITFTGAPPLNSTFLGVTVV